MAKDRFEPQLGRIGDTPVYGSGAFLKRLGKRLGVARSGASPPAQDRLFTGARIGRGYAIGKVLAARGAKAKRLQRPVYAKTRVKRLQPGLGAMRSHLRYLERDAIARGPDQGRFYDAGGNADPEQFLARSSQDRHQFRLMISPHDAAALESLEPFTRRLLAQIEKDLDARLDWIAIDHFDTAHPHVHMIVRGRDQAGKDLIIAPNYLHLGLAERAAELIDLELGPQHRRLGRRIDHLARRLEPTTLDRQLFAEAGPSGQISSTARDPIENTVRIARLRRLERLGLAQNIDAADWRLDASGLQTLEEIGRQRDLRQTIDRHVRAWGLIRSSHDYLAFPANQTSNLIVGRLLSGPNDQDAGGSYCVVDAVDGRVWRVELGSGRLEAPSGAILAFQPRDLAPRPEDGLALRIAQAFKGRYSAELHRLWEPCASLALIERLGARLENLAKFQGGPVRTGDVWAIGDDHLEHAQRFEKQISLQRPVQYRVLSPLPLERQVRIDAVSWLDRRLVGDSPEPISQHGFGRDVERAQALRQAWLIKQGLARKEAGEIVYSPGLLELLRLRELRRHAQTYAADTGLSYAPDAPGRRFTGRVHRVQQIISDQTVLLANETTFTFGPWRPELERFLGRRVTATFRGRSRGWAISQVQDLT